MADEKDIVWIAEIREDDPDFAARIEDLVNARVFLSSQEKELKERKAAADKELRAAIESYDADGLKTNTAKVEIVKRAGSLKWDRAYLQGVLHPHELERAQSRGADSSYVKVTGVQ